MDEQNPVGTSPQNQAGRGSRAGRTGAKKLTAAGVASLIERAEAAHAVGTWKAAKYADGDGLTLWIDPQARPYWRARYRLRDAYGKLVEKMASLGAVSRTDSDGKVTLATAREEMQKLRKQVGANLDPINQRKLEKLNAATARSNTFRALAEAWLAEQKPDWSAVHYDKSARALERDIYPILGDLPVADITPKHVRLALDGITKRGAVETAQRVSHHIGCIFRLAQEDGLRIDNPGQIARVRGKADRGRRPAFKDFPALGGVLRGVDAARIGQGTRLAHDVLVATVLRTNELVGLRWSELHLDGDTPAIEIPRARMKDKDKPFDHRVPLPLELAATLRRWKAVSGGTVYVFPGETETGHMSHETFGKLYLRGLNLRGQHVPHGWRASFSTLAHEAGHDSASIEIQLDHTHGSKVKARYDRGDRWQTRLAIMQWWWAELERAKVGAEVIELEPHRAS